MNILDRIATRLLAKSLLPQAERTLDELVQTRREVERWLDNPRVTSLIEKHSNLIEKQRKHVDKLKSLSAPIAVIKVPPGWDLRALAELIFSPKTFREVFEPICRDLYDEHCEALQEGKIWKARAALVRNYCAFWSAVAAQAPVSAFKVIYKIWKATLLN